VGKKDRNEDTGTAEKEELLKRQKEAAEALKKAASELAEKSAGEKEKPAGEKETAEAKNREKEKDSGKEGGKEEEKSASEKKDPKDEKIAELTDLLKRNLAEFDNFRKRTDKEKASMFDMGAKDILEKLLPVMDNFERSIQSAPDSPEVKGYTDGMAMILKQLEKIMEDAGVKPIECVGKQFDPAFHNAVMHEEDEKLGENVVSAELQKGYMYKDTVLRHSMVKVAN